MERFAILNHLPRVNGTCSLLRRCRSASEITFESRQGSEKGKTCSKTTIYVSLSRAREAMHVYTRNKLELRQSVMQPGERKSVWELLQAFQSSKPQRRDRKMPDLWAARQARIDRDVEMDR